MAQLLSAQLHQLANDSTREAAEAEWQSKPPSIDDSGGLIAAAEEGLGYVLARWTLVYRALRKGTLKLAGHGALPFGSAYYFVCPKPILALPKVAHFREWVFAAANEFPEPKTAGADA